MYSSTIYILDILTCTNFDYTANCYYCKPHSNYCIIL